MRLAPIDPLTRKVHVGRRADECRVVTGDAGNFVPCVRVLRLREGGERTGACGACALARPPCLDARGPRR